MLRWAMLSAMSAEVEQVSIVMPHTYILGYPLIILTIGIGVPADVTMITHNIRLVQLTHVLVTG